MTPRERLSALEQFGIKLGETTPDGEYTLLPIVCLGNCDKAPCMMVGGDLHSNLTPETLDKIFENYKQNHTPAANAPINPTAGGTE